MDIGLYLNGVYEEVLEEILKSQESNPGRIFYLQPYSESPIKELKNNPPNPNCPLPIYISTTTRLNQICYYADIVGWEDKNELSADRLRELNEHIKQFQLKEKRIYFEIKGRKCVNLISIRNLKKLSNPLSTEKLIKRSNGQPLKPRSRAGGWSYVYTIPIND